MTANADRSAPISADSSIGERRLEKESELSIFAFGAMFIRHRRRILRWMVLGALVAGVSVFARRTRYTSSAAFVPQTSDASRSNLANLAGQFGLAIPTNGNTQSPEFYVRLLKSRELIGAVVRDTFAVAELGGQRMAFLDLFDVDGADAPRRYEKAAAILSSATSASTVKGIGVVDLTVTTRWPSVSRAIVQHLLDGVVAFDRTTRQGQASSERKFIETRLAQVRVELRHAEDSMAQFMEANRQSNSPELSFQKDRLQREVSFQQALVTSLAQALEDARIREDRDTPVIVLVDPPSLPSLPDPRGAVKAVSLGALVGAALAISVAALVEVVQQKRARGDLDIALLLRAWSEWRGAFLRRFRRGASIAAP